VGAFTIWVTNNSTLRLLIAQGVLRENVRSLKRIIEPCLISGISCIMDSFMCDSHDWDIESVQKV